MDAAIAAAERAGRPALSGSLLDHIQATYALGPISGFRDLEGSRSLNVEIVTAEARLLVRVYRSIMRLPRLLAIQTAREALGDGGIPVSSTLPTASGASWSLFDGCLVEAERYVEHDKQGRMNTWERLEAGLPWLGRIHTIMAGVKLEPEGREAVIANHVSASDVLAVTERAVRNMRSWQRMSPEAQEFADLAGELALRLSRAEAAATTLPTQLVHGDYWDNNVYFEGDHLVLVTDLDFMGVRPRIDDLALTLYYTNSDFRDGQTSRDRRTALKRLANAYEGGLKQPLSLEERRALPLALARASLFLTRYLLLMNAEEAKVPIASTLPDLRWALQLLEDIELWQDDFARPGNEHIQ